MAIALQYIKQDRIDKGKWDRCIQLSPNGLIYAKSFWLDEMAGDWDALVDDDYRLVMPLTWRKKWGVRYLYQPSFTQQLGIFSEHVLGQEEVIPFIEVLKKEFPFAEIFLNYKNDGPFVPQPNYILSLDRPYELIREQYNEELIRNLQYAQKFELGYHASNDYKLVIQHYRELYGARTPHVDAEDYRRFAGLCAELESRNQLLVRVVSNPSQGILAHALLARDHRRIYYLLPVTLPQGRTFQANHFLVNELIREFCGQKLILDFEGSALPGVARFYRKFGAVDQPFFFYRHNRLPPPFKWFKS